MTVPIPILIALIVLALPTAVYLLLWLDGVMQRHGRCLIGKVDDFRDDHSYTIDTHLLYFRVWRETGFHSTWLFD